MPLTFPCPRDECVAVEHSRLDLVTHMRRRHGDATFKPSDARSVFTTQAEAQGGRRFTAAIACRTCGRDTRRTETDPMFRHCDDATPACVDPDTLKRYPTKESSTMTRIRPSTKSDREWYSSLDEQTRANARQYVTSYMDGGGTQAEAWTKARAAITADAAPVFDRVVKPAPEPKASARKPASERTAPSERTRGREPALVSYWLNDKPRRNLSDLAYDATRGMADPAPRMTAAQFRQYLTEQQITDPTASAWRLELPNGNVVHTTLREQRKAS